MEFQHTMLEEFMMNEFALAEIFARRFKNQNFKYERSSKRTFVP